MDLLPLFRSKTGYSLLLAFTLFVSAILTSVLATNARSLQSEAQENSSSSSYGNCYVSPNPASVGGNITVYGSGFKANQGITVKLTNDSGISFIWNTTDTNGNLLSIWRTYASGTNTISLVDTTTGATLTNCSFQGI